MTRKYLRPPTQPAPDKTAVSPKIEPSTFLARLPLPTLLTEDETAAAIGVKPATLVIWRCTKRYPLPYIKCGRLIRYRQDDVVAFLELRRVDPGGPNKKPEEKHHRRRATRTSEARHAATQ